MKRLYWSALWTFLGLTFSGEVAAVTLWPAAGMVLAAASGLALLVVIVWPVFLEWLGVRTWR
jgi:hypothetical protein